MALTVSLLGFSPAEAQTRVEELKTSPSAPARWRCRSGPC